MSNKIKYQTEEFFEYFGDELSRLENEVTRIERYQNELDEKIKNFDNPAMRGATIHYIEMSRNQIQITNLKRDFLKDITMLKKTILDYSVRHNDEGDKSAELMRNKLDDILNQVKLSDGEKKKKLAVIDTSELDLEIERKLNEG